MTNSKNTTEIIREVKAISANLLDKNINYEQAIDMLHDLSEKTEVSFSILYNAFYSSTPEIYF